MGKHYMASMSETEAKLARVMKRLEADDYQYDYNDSRSGSSCWVEMRRKGKAYRFENSKAKSAEAGYGLSYASDLLMAIVLTLEGLARASEQGIITLDIILSGLPALPAGPTEPPLEPCFMALGFSKRPASMDELKTQYRRMAKAMHPDTGGDEAAFNRLQSSYDECRRVMEAPNR